MIESWIVLTPVVALALVLLFSFAGCVGDEPAIEAAEDKGKKEGGDAATGAAAAAAAAAKYEAVIAKEPGLVSYWRLSEGAVADPTAKDSATGMPKDGQYQNPAGLQRGVPGALALVAEPGDTAVEFDGVQGFVEIGYDSPRNPPLNFSLELWVRPGPAPITTPQVVAGAYELDASGNVFRGFVLDVVSGPSPTTPTIEARVGNGTSFTLLSASLGDGSEHDGWRHVVVTYAASDPSDPTADHTLKLYINADDGKADATLPTAAIPQPVFYQANEGNPFRIGAGIAAPPAVPPTPGFFFAGGIDEVALYGTVLSGTVIQNHFLRATSLPS